jgi:hypothetical protein
MIAAEPRTHFTAWLVNDPSCLDQARCDITILQDQLIGADPDDERSWSTDTSKPQPFYAVTTVDAEDGDIDQALREAEALMSEAGWRLAGDWDAAPNAYTTTVERNA